MKKYEHRQLEWVCEHKCNVGEKYVLPQAQAFGLSWSTTTAGLADIQSCSWGRTEKQPQVATGWPSPPDSIGKQIGVEEQIVVQDLALQLRWGSGRRERPPTEQGTRLQLNQTRKEHAR